MLKLKSYLFNRPAQCTQQGDRQMHIRNNSRALEHGSPFDALMPLIMLSALSFLGYVYLWGLVVFFDLMKVVEFGRWLEHSWLPKSAGMFISTIWLFAWFFWPTSLFLVGMGLYRLGKFIGRRLRRFTPTRA